MNHIMYHKHIEATEFCTKILVESTTGMIRGIEKEIQIFILFLMVGYPKRSQKKLQWNLLLI